MSNVAIAKCNNYNIKNIYKTIEKSLNLLGDLGWNAKNKVLIKPNLLASYTPEKAVTTHPNFVEALVEYFQDIGMKVYIGESSGSATRGGTERVFKETGMIDIAKRRRIELINFDNDEHVNVNLEGKASGLISHIRPSKKLLEMDHIVDVPKLKTHTLTGYTGAIKNMFGIIPGRGKIAIHHKAGNSPERFSEMLVDIYSARIPDLIIMDAIVGMDGKGPSHGNPKKFGMILASYNGVSLDHVAASAMGFNPNDIHMIRIAKERGLVVQKEINSIGDNIPAIENISLPKIPKKIRGFSLFANLTKPSFHADSKNCVKCYQCKDACPERAISLNKNKLPVWDKNKCTTCSCCNELCQSDAVVIDKSLVAKVIDKFVGRFND